MTNKLAADLLREWDWHNRKHRCYYDSDEYDGYGYCPTMFPNLGEFLADAGLLVKEWGGQIFGRSFDEPSFRSQNSGKEIPVEEPPVEKPLSIRQARILKKSRLDSSYYTPVTDEVLKHRAEKASGKAENNQNKPWEIMAMEYYTGRLDTIDKHLHNLSMVLGELSERLDRIEDAVCAKSETVEEELSYGKKFRTVYEGF